MKVTGEAGRIVSPRRVQLRTGSSHCRVPEHARRRQGTHQVIARVGVLVGYPASDRGRAALAQSFESRMRSRRLVEL
jgi:hypothetical protein